MQFISSVIDICYVAVETIIVDKKEKERKKFIAMNTAFQPNTEQSTLNRHIPFQRKGKEHDDQHTHS